MTQVERKAATPLTDILIRRLKPGQKRADGYASPGAGRLLIWCKQGGGKGWFFRYFDAEGRERTLKLGQYPAMKLAEARKVAERWRETVASGSDPRFVRQSEADDHRRAERAAREAADLAARQGTFRSLIDSYVADLTAKGKQSAEDTRRTLSRHVLTPFAEMADRKANEITPDDITDVLARMINLGISRRTNIVRAMLRAAFAYGQKLEHDPMRKALAMKAESAGTEAPATSKLFRIAANPVAAVAHVRDFDAAGERVLSDEELRFYLRHLDGLHIAVRGLLRVSLLLGGQRLSQLKRVTWGDYADGMIRLVDGKGVGKAREHLLPVSRLVASEIEAMRAISPSGFIFSTTDGTKEVDLATASVAVTRISRAYAAESRRTGVSDPEHFSARDLRRTVETRLAKLGVAKEIRAHLLSHGRSSGVQAKHYDRHGYLPEKGRALSIWEGEIARVLAGEPVPSKVIGAASRAA